MMLYRKKPGKTRIKLAEILAAAIPGLSIQASDLELNNPRYASAEYDSCKWSAFAPIDGRIITISSWDSMGACVKYGIDVLQEDQFSWSVSVKTST